MDKEFQAVIERVDSNMDTMSVGILEIKKDVKALFTLSSSNDKELAVVKSKVDWHNRIATGVLMCMFTVITFGIIKLALF